MNRSQMRAATRARGPDVPRVRGSASTEHKLGEAVSRHQAGRLAEANRLYAEVLSREPNNVVALNLLGVIEF